jgi:hypothetical protein
MAAVGRETEAQRERESVCVCGSASGSASGRAAEAAGKRGSRVQVHALVLIDPPLIQRSSAGEGGRGLSTLSSRAGGVLCLGREQGQTVARMGGVSVEPWASASALAWRVKLMQAMRASG